MFVCLFSQLFNMLLWPDPMPQITHSEKLPIMLVLGPKEAQSNTVNLRIRGDKQTKTIGLEQFLTIAKRKITDKELNLAFTIGSNK